INVLAACNQNLQFIYCLAGWEGSAHDSKVLRDALSRPGGFRVPESMHTGSFILLKKKSQPTYLCYITLHTVTEGCLV
ncbi:hypothetical protein LINPERHAP1_LOCUS16910, partial [Linum perenne]